MKMEKIKTIEIVINGTERVKTNWAVHNIEVEPEDMFKEMTEISSDLAHNLRMAGKKNNDNDILGHPHDEHSNG
jgi:hypothetical protein